MIQISMETVEMLDRAAELHMGLVTDSLCEDCKEEAEDEYIDLQMELVDEFLPLVRKLVKAGVISVQVDKLEEAEKYENLFGLPVAAHDDEDGTITLYTIQNGGIPLKNDKEPIIKTLDLEDGK